MSSNPPQRIDSKERWDRGFAALCKFRGRNGHCCPPYHQVEGKFKLGSWVVTQRHLFRKKLLPLGRFRRLDRIDFVWDWHDDQWERNFKALCKFHAREGHCCPSRVHVESKFSLGPWVTTQRYFFRKKLLPAERKRRLDAIGFVWDWRDHQWEQSLAALAKFKDREGHCCVPIFHNEGKIRLGWWVSTQRKKKDKMSRERKARLNKIGFVWNARTGPRRGQVW